MTYVTCHHQWTNDTAAQHGISEHAGPGSAWGTMRQVPLAKQDAWLPMRPCLVEGHGSWYEAYCETCHTCKTTKLRNQKPYGLLNPLAMPSYPWELIGMDFVSPLPESGNQDGVYNSITVVICLLTAMVHLTPSWTNYNTIQLAKLMFKHIYKLHGLPRNIISYQDVLFTSTFWDHLHWLIGMKLQMSSAYHPQSDRSTEWANCTVTQMLHQCIHQPLSSW